MNVLFTAPYQNFESGTIKNSVYSFLHAGKFSAWLLHLYKYRPAVFYRKQVRYSVRVHAGHSNHKPAV